MHLPDNKVHAVDTYGLSSTAVKNERCSNLDPDAFTVQVEESVVATE